MKVYQKFAGVARIWESKISDNSPVTIQLVENIDQLGMFASTKNCITKTTSTEQ